MRSVLLAAVALLASPAAASAGVSLTMREVPLHGERVLAASGPPVFDLVGLHWRGPGSVDFRTRSLAGRWSAWRRAAPEAEDLPDVQSPEAGPARGWRLGDPYWAGSFGRIAYPVAGPGPRLSADL